MPAKKEPIFNASSAQPKHSMEAEMVAKRIFLYALVAAVVCTLLVMVL